jgi:hypothetical protein
VAYARTCVQKMAKCRFCITTRRLDLHLLCTYRRPVKGIWPELPIVVSDYRKIMKLNHRAYQIFRWTAHVPLHQLTPPPPLSPAATPPCLPEATLGNKHLHSAGSDENLAHATHGNRDSNSGNSPTCATSGLNISNLAYDPGAKDLTSMAPSAV